MTQSIILGADVDGAPVGLDLETLLRTRLLIQASSGGGKSRTLRRIAEQAFGKVPIIIIDPEGEFASLRERYDFVLVGEGGETTVDVRTAPLLARRLLETRASAIVDLFEVKGSARFAWLAAFLDALMEAPRDLWTDYLILVDEAEDFAPEKGQGEAESGKAVMDVAKRGRKRGYALVLASLRLSRMNKNVLAQMGNAMVGRTTMDIDLDRSADALGARRGRAREELQEALVALAPGHFYARGPAFQATAGGPVPPSVLVTLPGVHAPLRCSTCRREVKP